MRCEMNAKLIALLIGENHVELRDSDLLFATDETACWSTLVSGDEDWGTIGPGDVGLTVEESKRDDMDAKERLFRRRRLSTW